MKFNEIIRICFGSLAGGIAGYLIGGFMYNYILENFLVKEEEIFEEIYEEEEEEEEEMPITNEFIAKLKQNIKTDKPLGAVFIIRKDLKMGKGKILAQCGHATLGIFVKVLNNIPFLAEGTWRKGFPKKYFYCNSEKEMDECVSKAMNLGFLTEKIHDAGRTQIAAGSATVVSIGPIPIDRIPEICGNLSPAK